MKAIIFGQEEHMTKELVTQSLDGFTYGFIQSTNQDDIEVVACSSIDEVCYVPTSLTSGNNPIVEWSFLNCIPTKTFKSNYGFFDEAADKIRNRRMCKHVNGSGVLVLIWDGKDKRCQLMKDTAEYWFVKVVEVIVA